MAKYGAKTAKLWCIFGVYMLDFLHFCCQGGENVIRRGVFVVKFGVIRPKNVEILCRNAEITASYAEIPYCFRAFVVRFQAKISCNYCGLMIGYGVFCCRFDCLVVLFK